MDRELAMASAAIARTKRQLQQPSPAGLPPTVPLVSTWPPRGASYTSRSARSTRRPQRTNRYR
jgi:hypothetical protein